MMSEKQIKEIYKLVDVLEYAITNNSDLFETELKVDGQILKVELEPLEFLRCAVKGVSNQLVEVINWEEEEHE